MNAFRAIFLSVIVWAPCQSLAQDFTTCKLKDIERTIEIVRKETGKSVPCDVVYTRGGTSKVMFSATTQTGYCEQKAVDLAARLNDSGWKCKIAQSQGE